VVVVVEASLAQQQHHPLPACIEHSHWTLPVSHLAATCRVAFDAILDLLGSDAMDVMAAAASVVFQIASHPIPMPHKHLVAESKHRCCCCCSSCGTFCRLPQKKPELVGEVCSEDALPKTMSA